MNRTADLKKLRSRVLQSRSLVHAFTGRDRVPMIEDVEGAIHAVRELARARLDESLARTGCWR